MRREKLEHGVALLDPPLSAKKRPWPGDSYRRRYREAAWRGLGIVFATSEGEAWSVGEEVVAPELAAIGDELERALLGAAEASWASVTSSPKAETLLRPHLEPILETHGYKPTNRSYTSFWRQPETDGAWAMPHRPRKAIALEVKVDEDPEAPFGQVVDDLGHFDAVLQVRLLRSEAIRQRIYEVPGLAETVAQFQDRLPVKLITLRFCSLCERPLPFAGVSYPNLVCTACDDTALNERGLTPTFDGFSDSGENPVWIRGQQCWRRYRFGGYVTMLDPQRCPSLEAFYAKNKQP